MLDNNNNTKWVEDSNDCPSLWLAPKATDAAACEAAKGNYLTGFLMDYKEITDKDSGKVSPIYTFHVTESNLKEAHQYAGKEGGFNQYVTVPLSVQAQYSIRAAGQLHKKLSRYWSEAVEPYRGLLKVIYGGLGDPYLFERDGQKTKVRAHQFTVMRDADAELPAPRTASALPVPEREPVEESFPALEDAPSD